MTTGVQREPAEGTPINADSVFGGHSGAFTFGACGHSLLSPSCALVGGRDSNRANTITPQPV